VKAPYQRIDLAGGYRSRSSRTCCNEGDKRGRKAFIGSWRENLTQDQKWIVDEITAPLLSEFYRDA